MSALQTIAGVQSLRSITARSSSSRVLDLHSLAIDCAENPAHREQPMFTHPVLNRTIIAKHHPRLGDFDYRPNRRAVTTKVIFPFDAGDLDLGGQFLLVDEPDLVGQLARHLDYGGADLEHDIQVLRLMDDLPTLDPFLLAEALNAAKREVAPCYFRLSPADRADMLDFVAKQVETLIELCFPDMTIDEGRAKRLSELLLAEGDSPELDPLREAMRLGPGEFARSIFFWKAVLFYRWRSRLLAPEMKATRRSIATVDVKRFDTHAARFVAQAVGQLESMINNCERRIAEMFKAYDDVFAELTEKRSPEPFRRFLLDGPRLFARLGVRMGRLEQLISYWGHQFPESNTRRIPPEQVFDGMRNLVNALSLRGSRAQARKAAGIVWTDDDRVESRQPVFRRAG